MKANPRLISLIETLVSAYSLPVSGERLRLAERWLNLLLEWNAKIDLTAARSDEELVDLMLADSALLSRHIAPGAFLMDVGTGAGAPGLGILIFRPDIQGILVEPMQKRVAFLNTVIGELITMGFEAGRVKVLRERAEKLEAREREGEETVMVSRATLSPEQWLREGARLGPRGGVWVLLSQQERPELEGWEAVYDEQYRWPLTGAQRRAVRYGRMQPEEADR